MNFLITLSTNENEFSDKNEFFDKIEYCQMFNK